MHFFEFLFVPTILFMVIVMPIWIVLHYRYKSKTSGGLGEADQKQLDTLLRTADTLADRITTLESILDERQPNWRRQNKQ
ncbi:envelope stress response membrane protein PspB [Natronospirillum operosum]|uniref:Envelope stress response membrane protein PspB n=1 Tax=Natronospirillum operosum TaxID=2759953 RepID=A0A4Z0WG32_9GAMM|nr:envelope stress response membrane protein PspB [Natronospirillum operosum]TGG93450.1 envelope stress response membrane protein PspB [Natronospirillum operosum]